MADELFFNGLVTKSLHPIHGDDRFFEGYLTVQVKDKQGEITIVDELIKVLPLWMDRGAPITDTHSNRVVGKGINYSKTVYKTKEGVEYPAIKITGKIYKNYELDNEIWQKIIKGEYKGLSFGGATKADRDPIRMKDGSVAYSLKELEHYEVAVCADPAVPLALITDHNPLAKAMVQGTTEERDGKMVIKCSKFGCYVGKVRIDHKDDDVAQKKQTAEALAELGHPEAENTKKLLEERGIKSRSTKPCPNCGKTGGIVEAQSKDDPEKWFSMAGTDHKTGEDLCPECDRKQFVREESQKTDNITKPIPDGKGGKGEFDHCESVNQDKDDPAAFCGAIQHKLEKAVNEGNLESLEKNGLEFFATKEELNKVCSACGKTLAEHGVVKYDHSNTQGDQHGMYNQNTGRETWVGQGLPQPKVEGKDDNPTEKDLPINADSRLKKDSEELKSKAKMAKLKVTIMTTKTEENMIGAGQRGLGHDHGSVQGSGQSHQITEVKDDEKLEEFKKATNALGRLLSQMGKRPKKEKDVMYDEEKKSGYVTEDGNKKTGDLERGDESSVKPVE
jgi:hypothetical protein